MAKAKSMTWEEYSKWAMQKEIKKYGSMRNLEKELGLCKSQQSKILNGKLIPRQKFFEHWFPDLIIPEFKAVVIIDD